MYGLRYPIHDVFHKFASFSSLHGLYANVTADDGGAASVNEAGQLQVRQFLFFKTNTITLQRHKRPLYKEDRAVTDDRMYGVTHENLKTVWPSLDVSTMEEKKYDC